MTTPKFTPGPWRLSDESPKIVMAGANTLIGSAAGHPNSGLYPPMDEAVANAALFCAAPELYEALDALSLVVGLTAFKHEGQRAPLQDAVDAARAALAKARGEA